MCGWFIANVCAVGRPDARPRTRTYLMTVRSPKPQAVLSLPRAVTTRTTSAITTTAAITAATIFGTL